MKRAAILFGVIAAAIAVVYLRRAKEPSPVMNASELDPAALHRSFASGSLSGTAVKIRASETRDPDLLLLAASCYLHLGDTDEFRSVINEAIERGMDPAGLKLAMDLFRVQIGDFNEPAEQVLVQLEQRGVPQDDARRAVVMGCLMRSDLEGATGVIDRWYLQNPDFRESSYLRAMVAISQSRWSDAENLLLDSIARNEQHELSYLALADMYSQPPNTNLLKCRTVFEQCMLRFPENKIVALRLARVNRESGNRTAASAILDTQNSSRVVLFEKADLAFDGGQYAESTELMGQGGGATTADFISMIDAEFRANLNPTESFSEELSQRVMTGATALALGGRNQEAAVIFDFQFDRSARQLRFRDLQIQSELSPNDQTIADEIKLMVSPALNPGCPTLAATSQDSEEDSLDPGDRLYREHCAKCHGRNGDGFGMSARHLFPAPRNFRDEPMRIVSTVNRIASDQDLAKVIRQGLGGVSMPAFPQLSAEQIEKLVTVVRRLQVDGLRDRYEHMMRKFSMEDDRIDEDESSGSAAELWVKQRSTPGEPLEIPTFDDLSDDITARGMAAFDRAACSQCHTLSTEDGNEGLRFFDTLGRPVAIRHLDTDRFRGGNSHEEIYKRIVLGIPGTPHPAASGLSEKELVDIVQYVHKLSTKSHENERPLSPTTTNFQRRLQSRAVGELKSP